MNIVHRQVLKDNPVTDEQINDFAGILEKRRSEIGGQRSFFGFQDFSKVYWPSLLP